MPRYSACSAVSFVSFTPSFEVQAGDLFVELLGQHVDAERVFVGFGPERDLREDLVGERVGHDERRMAGGAAEVHQAPSASRMIEWPSGKV